MSRKLIGWGGIAAAGGAAYYLYNAGGDPKLAEKQFEHDAATAARKIKGEVPGREKEAQKAGEESYEAMRVKAQELTDKAKAEADKAGKKLEEVRQETGTKLNQAVDTFDKKVTEGTAQSKSWISGWFGGK